MVGLVCGRPLCTLMLMAKLTSNVVNRIGSVRRLPFRGFDPQNRSFGGRACASMGRNTLAIKFVTGRQTTKPYTRITSTPLE